MLLTLLHFQAVGRKLPSFPHWAAVRRLPPRVQLLCLPRATTADGRTLRHTHLAHAGLSANCIRRKEVIHSRGALLVDNSPLPLRRNTHTHPHGGGGYLQMLCSNRIAGNVRCSSAVLLPNDKLSPLLLEVFPNKTQRPD